MQTLQIDTGVEEFEVNGRGPDAAGSRSALTAVSSRTRERSTRAQMSAVASAPAPESASSARAKISTITYTSQSLNIRRSARRRV